MDALVPFLNLYRVKQSQKPPFKLRNVFDSKKVAIAIGILVGIVES